MPKVTITQTVRSYTITEPGHTTKRTVITTRVMRTAAPMPASIQALSTTPALPAPTAI